MSEMQRLRALWPNAARLDATFRLAADFEVCADPLAGHPVDRELLDRDALVWAHERRLVQLVRPIDLLDTSGAGETSA